MLRSKLIHYHPIFTWRTKESFEKIFRYELDVKTKERIILLLVLNLVYRGKVSAQVARDLNRSNPLALGY
jgi:hypothetical protein